jgi:sarcosine reductase
MRLELNILEIKDIRFGEETIVRDRTLSINREELRQHLLQDPRLKEVEIELAHPGEHCRILQISDVIEPRAKVDEGAVDFPGVLGTAQAVAGEGRTCVLRGTAVLVNDQSERCGPSHDAIGNILDMSGPIAELTPYSRTQNIVVLPYPAEGISPDDYKVAQKMAGLKTAVYLARAGRSTKPDHVEVYDLQPLTQLPREVLRLPRIAYVFQAYCTSFPPIEGEPVLYGDGLRKLTPTLIHPNEIMDGAVINPYQGMGIETYQIQNHPVIRALYERQGKELCFAGVILTVSRYTEPERERSAAYAANLAKYVLGADGVIATKSSSGAPEIDLAQTMQRCEEMGVKAVFITWAGKQDDSDEEGTAIFNLPKADALISTGSPLRGIDIPVARRIIGRQGNLETGESCEGPFRRRLLFIAGAVGQLGNSKWVATRY